MSSSRDISREISSVEVSPSLVSDGILNIYHHQSIIIHVSMYPSHYSNPTDWHERLVETYKKSALQDYPESKLFSAISSLTADW